MVEMLKKFSENYTMFANYLVIRVFITVIATEKNQ